MPKRIYLAGPDVFFPDAQAIAQSKKAICAEFGLHGLFPTDLLPEEVHGEPEHTSAQAHGLYIAQKCEAHMRAADGMIANLTPWRGVGADVGTAYELGFMRALARPVCAYSNDSRSHTARVKLTLGASLQRDSLGVVRTEDGYLIENFGEEIADNIMLDNGVLQSGGAPVLMGHLLPEQLAYYSDLTAFRLAVQQMAKILRG